MKWFVRWILMAAVLEIISATAAWLFLTNKTTVEILTVMFWCGIGSLILAGLITVGATDSLEDGYGDGMIAVSSKSPRTSWAEEYVRQRVIRGSQAAPAAWAFALIGMVVTALSILMQEMF